MTDLTQERYIVDSGFQTITNTYTDLFLLRNDIVNTTFKLAIDKSKISIDGDENLYIQICSGLSYDESNQENITRMPILTNAFHTNSSGINPTEITCISLPVNVNSICLHEDIIKSGSNEILQETFVLDQGQSIILRAKTISGTMNVNLLISMFIL